MDWNVKMTGMTGMTRMTKGMSCGGDMAHTQEGWMSKGVCMVHVANTLVRKVRGGGSLYTKPFPGHDKLNLHLDQSSCDLVFPNCVTKCDEVFPDCVTKCSQNCDPMSKGASTQQSHVTCASPPVRIRSSLRKGPVPKKAGFPCRHTLFFHQRQHGSHGVCLHVVLEGQLKGFSARGDSKSN